MVVEHFSANRAWTIHSMPAQCEQHAFDSDRIEPKIQLPARIDRSMPTLGSTNAAVRWRWSASRHISPESLFAMPNGLGDRENWRLRRYHQRLVGSLTIESTGSRLSFWPLSNARVHRNSQWSRTPRTCMDRLRFEFVFYTAFWFATPIWRWSADLVFSIFLPTLAWNLRGPVCENRQMLSTKWNLERIIQLTRHAPCTGWPTECHRNAVNNKPLAK